VTTNIVTALYHIGSEWVELVAWPFPPKFDSGVLQYATRPDGKLLVAVGAITEEK